MKNRFLFLTIPLLLAACASVPLPEETLSRVNPGVELVDIKQNPERYQGYTLLLGGKIVENTGAESGSTLEILQYRLDRSGRPIDVNENGGRFLVRTDRFLDPEVYGKGEFIVLVGTFAGSETKPLQGVNYRFPVFSLDSAYIWREPLYYGYPGYYPAYYGPAYYYDPFYDPFWSYRSPWYYNHWGYRHGHW